MDSSFLTKENDVVSIITPAYNCIEAFKSVFDSVLMQTYLNWEWIIVDDCSNDGSFEYIKKMAQNDSRIIVLQTEYNGGTSVARNVGLKRATGRFITFLDSDDLIDKDYLEKQIAFIKVNGPIISSGYRRSAKKSCTPFFVPKKVDYKLALKGNPLSCLTTMYDRTIIGERYFPENLKKCEDYVFWLNILKDGFVVSGNPKVLATYVIHNGSKSYNKIKLIKYMFRVYHETQSINWFKSWFFVIRWAFYGTKKYKNVR